VSGYELQPFRPELLDEVARLARQIRGGTHEQQLAYYEWKYLRNPYIAEPLLHLALKDGRAVGLRAFYGTCWESGAAGQRYVFPAESDSAVLEEHRGGDMYRRLGDALLAEAAGRGFTHLLNLRASPEMAVTAILSFGWKGLGPRGVLAIPGQEQPSEKPTPLRQRVPAPIRALVRKARGRLGRAPEHRSSVFASLDRSGPWIDQGVETRVTRSSAELAEVAGQVDRDARLQLARDEDFYRWRFASPAAEYRFLVARGEEPETCGYLVLCKKQRPSVFVLDWQATTTAVARQLLATAVSTVGVAALSTWSASLSEDDVAMLHDHGFVPAPKTGSVRWQKSLLVRPVADPDHEESWTLDGTQLDAASSWNVRATASDSF